MLTFDPDARITVPQALKHPWLESYHDADDEPDCPETFEKWRKIEELETLEDYREALWKEIEDYRREVRGVLDISGMPIRRPVSDDSSSSTRRKSASAAEPDNNTLETVVEQEPAAPVISEGDSTIVSEPTNDTIVHVDEPVEDDEKRDQDQALPVPRRVVESADPVVTYARRSSIISRQGSVYNSPLTAHHVPAFVDGPLNSEPGPLPPQGGIAFPTQGYVVPARSRTGSTVGGEVTRRLLRTLSTVSIHESAEGLAGGLGQIAPIGKYIVEANETTGADAPASEMPRDFLGEVSEPEEYEEVENGKQRERKKFQI